MNRMIFNRKNDLVWICMISLFLMVGGVGCYSAPPEKPSAPPSSSSQKLLFLPFEDMTVQYGKNAEARCPLSRKIFMTGEVHVDAESFLNDRVLNLLRSHTTYQILPAGSEQGIQSALISGAKTQMSELSYLVQTGLNVSADMVMIGHIYRFEDRVGTKYAVDSPASVAFDLHLIRVRDARLVWTESFDETQRPLDENLLKLGSFLKRKGTWVSAHEMANIALEEMFESFK